MKYRALVIVVLFVSTAVFIAKAEHAEPRPVKEPLQDLPLTIGPWQGRNGTPLTPEILAVLGVDEYLTRTYRRTDGTLAGLYIGYYQSQRQGDSIHSPLNCLPGAGWIPVQQGRQRLTVESHQHGREIEINRVVIEKGLDRQLVLYWYQSHNRVIASEYWGKVFTVVDAIRDNRTDAALVRVTVPIADRTDASGQGAAEAGTAFVQGLFGVLEQHLPS